MPAPSDRAVSLGTRLHAARQAAGLTQAQVAQRAGLGRSRIAEWEAGVHMPGADTLQRLAAVYGVTVDSLHGRPDPAARPPAYWAGRLDEIADAMALQVDRLRAISRAAQGATPPVPDTLVPPPSEAEMARARALLDEQLALDRAAESQTHEPPARRPRRAGGKG